MLWQLYLLSSQSPILNRSDESDDDYEMADHEINNIIIVTQTPPANKKHPGGDRTGYHESRAKITTDLSKIINDGLYYYEMDLWEVTYLTVNWKENKHGSPKQV